MEIIKSFFYSFISVMKTFQVKDLFDIIAIAFIIYSLNKLIRETRAFQLLKGVFVLVIGYVLSSLFNFVMLSSLLKTFFEFSVIVIFIVFQPEVRRLLEQLGRSKISGTRIKKVAEKNYDINIYKKRELIETLAESARVLSSQRTGALIVIERSTKLGDIATTGTLINAYPSVKLFGNIFFNKAPLHDGAVIIREDCIYAAGCVLPLTVKEESIESHMGTRHRAAVGISEESDAVVIVVSEETGTISLAYNGTLSKGYDKNSLTESLEKFLINEEDLAQDTFLSKLYKKIPFINKKGEKDE